MRKNSNIELLDRYFAGEATKEDAEQLLKLLENPEYGISEMEKIWGEATPEMNLIVRNRIFKNINKKINTNHSFPLKLWLRVAAILILFISTSLSGYLLYKAGKTEIVADMLIKVEKGQKASVILPDGSKVWINSGSTLSYGRQFNSKERILNLDGEAYFEVAPNTDAPFIVNSNELHVRALGTAFNLKAYSEDRIFSTALLHGKVEVSDNNGKVYLTPNQKTEYDRVSRNFKKTDEDDCGLYTGWRNNQISFDSETFGNIAQTLERNYNVKFIFQSEKIRNYHYSGTIGNTSIDSMLQLFSMTSPLAYHIEGTTIYLSENKKMMPLYDNILNK